MLKTRPPPRLKSASPPLPANGTHNIRSSKFLARLSGYFCMQVMNGITFCVFCASICTPHGSSMWRMKHSCGERP